MPAVLLVRHGQASFGSADYDRLSEAGRAQSARVGDELRRRALRDPLVLSGGLRRQRDTAALALPGASVQVDERFDEYDHQGLLERHLAGTDRPVPTTSREVQDVLDEAMLLWARGDGPWGPDGPSYARFADGAVQAVRETAAALGSGRDAVVFTSGGVVAAVAAALLGGGPETVVALHRTAVNGAVTTVLGGRRGLSLVSWNEHAHLPAGAVTYR